MKITTHLKICAAALTVTAFIGLSLYAQDYASWHQKEDTRGLNRVIERNGIYDMGDATHRKAVGSRGISATRPATSPATIQQRQAAVLQDLWGISDKEIGQPVKLFVDKE